MNELKKKLKDLGLDYSGEKQTLVDRITEYKNSNAKIETPVINFDDPVTKEILLNLGQKTEKMLVDHNTPEEMKEKGFAAIFHEAWLKEHPESSLSKSKLCMIYTKLDIAWR